MSESVSRSGQEHNSSPRQTPLQSRSYLNMAHGIHQSPHNHSGTPTPHMIQETNSVASDDTGVIFGTNISTRHVISQLQVFITDFTDYKMVGGERVLVKIYYNQLNDIDVSESNIFNVEGVHLKAYSQDIYNQFIYYPAQMISCFDFVLKRLYERLYITEELDEQRLLEKQIKRDRLMMGIRHLDSITPMRSLLPAQINRLICFRGIVVRTSEIYPELKRAVFRCTNCQNETQVVLENAKVQEPINCLKCRRRHTYELIHNYGEFSNKQFVKFQELPEMVPEGQTPNALTIICYDSNVDGMRPGDRVEVVGIYRVHSVKVQRSKAVMKSVFNTYIDLISFRVLEENRFKAPDAQSKTLFNDEDRNQFQKMAARPTIITDLIKSFAPSIFGQENIKKGILAQLFGGRKKYNDAGQLRCRADINICLVGDPSTAKSQLLQQVNKISSRGIYTSGRGSSAVGLTANVRKDPETREFILESGALVLSDLGICCIDEFDKMDQNSRTILLEAMEQQTISIAKAGIVCQLNSRTAILAAANPVNSRYNPKKSVVENINLSPAILTRFDLIYILLDKPNEAYDRYLASHILNIFSSRESTRMEQQTFSRDLLTKYITFAREYIQPVLSDEAGQKLVEAYTEMRRHGNSRKTVTATPRQLESMIRLSEAFAKMRLSSEVSVQDAEQAVELIKVAIQEAATDPSTGIIDMDIIVTGKTVASRNRVEKLIAKIEEIVQANVKQYRKNNPFEKLKEKLRKEMSSETESVEDKDVLEALKHLETKGLIIVFSNKNKTEFRLANDLQQ